jgi:queuine tRNA-ribosyltransferase
MFKFTLLSKDQNARTGVYKTPRGDIKTPVFMPVGTHAALKALTPRQVEDENASIILSNTYHLFLKPGSKLIKKAGGLHKFMMWDKPILTDSGGFQVFSLNKDRKIIEDGIIFKSQEGEKILLTPELVIETQHELGSDIIMPLDECIAYPAKKEYAKESVNLTIKWEKRCLEAHKKGGAPSALFAIVQGSVYEDLRRECAKELVDMDFPGYAIGGVSVGEGHDLLKKVVDMTEKYLPEDKPRYLMGVGLPEDIIESVERGIDMFDCIIPTRYARGGTLFTNRGKIRINHKNYRRDFYPIEPNCSCYACKNFSRSYLHHLFTSNEITGTILASIHNVSWYLQFMERIREAIEAKRFASFKEDFFKEYGFKK